MSPRRSARVAAAAAASKATATAVPAPASGKRKAESASATAKAAPATPPVKIKKTNLASAVTTDQPLGVIDPESGLTGKIVTLDGAQYDIMMVLVEPSQNMDKFYILQWIETTKGEQVVYSRWGRTGTKGQGQKDIVSSAEEAQAAFEKKFKQKCGLKWEERDADTVPAGKCRVVQQDFEAKQSGYAGASWQYWYVSKKRQRETGMRGGVFANCAALSDFLKSRCTTTG